MHSTKKPVAKEQNNRSLKNLDGNKSAPVWPPNWPPQPDASNIHDDSISYGGIALLKTSFFYDRLDDLEGFNGFFPRITVPKAQIV